MINLMISDKEKKDQSQTSMLYDVSSYPYGMKIQVDPETYKKLGLAEVPDIGEKMMIMAYVEVCSLYKENGKGDEQMISMGLQITDIEVKPMAEEKEEKSPESVIYEG